MLSSAIFSFGLLLAPLASATVYDITVGSSSGATTFSPEAIVGVNVIVLDHYEYEYLHYTN